MSEADRRTAGGELTYEEIMAFIEQQEWPVTSKLLAEEFGISQQGAYYRLKQLQEQSDVERQKIGKNVVLWRSAR